MKKLIQAHCEKLSNRYRIDMFNDLLSLEEYYPDFVLLLDQRGYRIIRAR
jgi:hypothetical protein